jgi:tetratricopeptide (TPR) repeat protein
MMRPAYESDPLPFGLSEKHYQQGGLNDYLPVIDNPNIKGAINAVQFLKAVEQEHPQLQIPTSISSYNSVPGRRMILAGIDTSKIKSMVPDNLKDKVQPYMDFNIKGRALEKKDLAVLDLIVNGNWERPIYFNNTSLAGVNLELSQYMVQEGIAYRLLPVLNDNPQSSFPVNTDLMYDNVMNKFKWTALNDPDVYYSEDYLGFCLNSRSTFNSLARALINEGDYERAKNSLIRCLEVMPNESIPYDYFNIQQVDLLLQVGEPGLAADIAVNTSTEAVEWLDYYISRDVTDPITLQKKLLYLNELARAYRANDEREEANKYETMFSEYYSRIAGQQLN